MLIECMSKRNFQFRRLRPILLFTGPAEHTRSPAQRLNSNRIRCGEYTVPRAGSKGPSMKLPTTVGLAVAVSLIAATVALAQLSGAASTGPAANGASGRLNAA
jgi:hypothetical protein